MNRSQTMKPLFNVLPAALTQNRWVLVVILVVALGAFEVFNYSTTHFALTDLLGDLRFSGVRWSTLLALAFCGIDFAGIAQLFMPTQASHQKHDSWYLFGAWLLAALMNAILTWWGVTMAIRNHTIASLSFLGAEKTLMIIPIFIALMVWVIRILMIGMLSSIVSQLVDKNKINGQPMNHQHHQHHQPAYQPMRNFGTTQSSRYDDHNSSPDQNAEDLPLPINAGMPAYHTFSSSPSNRQQRR